MIGSQRIEEQDLIDLDFNKVLVSKEEHGGENDFYYYVANLFGEDGPCLISNSNDDVVNSKWKVELFDYDGYYFDDIKHLTDFMLSAKNVQKKKNNIYFRVVHENGSITEFDIYSENITIDLIIETLEFIVSIQ